MNRYKVYGGTPHKTSRLKTDHFVTQDTSKITESPLSSTAREYTDRTYYDIAISRSKVSQREGYLSRRKKQLSERQQSASKPHKKRLLVFKNLQEFDIQLKTQHGRLDVIQSPLSAFGISTYKGTGKSINTHQISVHVGELTALTLIQGYDGLFAATELKKHFSNELLLGFKGKKNNSRQEPFRVAETTIKKALEHSKKRLKKTQQERGDNSGASFLSVVVHKGITFATNCGSGQAICMTKNGRLVKLARPHTTSNESEVDRIVKEGGQLYQTIVNVPFRKDMHVTGPLRVYPEGLTVTRTLGKSLTKHKRVQTVSNTVRIHKGVLSEPQLQFIPTSQIRWVALLSSRIAETVSAQRVRDVIEQQLKRKRNDDNSTDVAEHCCKRLILEAVQSGQSSSLSALLIIGQLQTPSAPILETEKKQPQIHVTPAKLKKEPRSLKYIGNRANFVELQSQY